MLSSDLPAAGGPALPPALVPLLQPRLLTGSLGDLSLHGPGLPGPRGSQSKPCRRRAPTPGGSCLLACSEHSECPRGPAADPAGRTHLEDDDEGQPCRQDSPEVLGDVVLVLRPRRLPVVFVPVGDDLGQGGPARGTRGSARYPAALDRVSGKPQAEGPPSGATPQASRSGGRCLSLRVGAGWPGPTVGWAGPEGLCGKCRPWGCPRRSSH